MSVTNAAVNWAVAKRYIHWGIALAIIVALIAPKPEHGEGFVHMAAGSTALALVLVRLVWRMSGEVKPYFRDALRFRLPTALKNNRALAPLFLQSGRLIGLLFLALVPVAFGFAIVGIAQGEDSALLEAHEAVGKAIMFLAIAHGVAIIVFAVLLKYDLLGVTVTGPARTFGEGGARGLAAMAIGAAVALAALAYLWGPYDIQGKATALAESEHGNGRHDSRYEME